MKPVGLVAIGLLALLFGALALTLFMVSVVDSSLVVIGFVALMLCIFSILWIWALRGDPASTASFHVPPPSADQDTEFRS